MPNLISLGALIVSSIATTTIAANALYLGTLALAYGGLAYGASLLQSLFVQKPSVPKPEDGSYNLKQPVPSLSIVLGRVKKGGDYLFLEELDGTAYHVICHAGHRIQGYVQHYLHDEAVTLDENGYTISPSHFGDHVNIQTRVGLNIETAYADLVATFPTIYTNDHRGDGLATIRMAVETVKSEDYLKVFPNQMPQPTEVIDGALVYDPRNPAHDPDDKETWEYATNLALLRLHHLTNPWGGKLSKADMYMPEWAQAAEVCDQIVVNRAGEDEPRYHGGIWFRANNDQIQVGQLMDQAAELVVYERSDGLIGVHAGEFVEPTLRLDGDSILSLSYKANRSDAATVLAVRGRFTDPDQTYTTVDAAIYGNPYIANDDTERTKTVDNQVIQSHNHCQRIQKITFTRANAPRVSIVAAYEEASEIGSHRFIRAHYPPKLDEAIIEITSTPKLSLANMTVEFSGIVMPATLYDFVAADDEGVPPTVPVKIVSSGVPLPSDFDVVIQTDDLGGGQMAAFAHASWTLVSPALTYEFEWQPTTGSAQVPNSVMSRAGETSARSSFLADGTSYRFRLRAWSNGAPSEWTDYITRNVVVDGTAPAALTTFMQTAAAPHLGNAVFSIATPNDSHIKTVKLYRKATGTGLDISTDTPFATLSVNSLGAYTYTDGDVTRTNIITGGDFASSGDWTTQVGGATVTGGKAVHTAGSSGSVRQSKSLTIGATYRYQFGVTGSTAGTVQIGFFGGTTNLGSLHSGNGSFLGSKATVTGNNVVGLVFSSTSDASADDFIMYEQSVTSAPQGAWDYYAVPFNGSGIAGPSSGPVTVTII